MKKYCIFIFRRDLRIIDNNGLHYALQHYDNIIPIFIFTPEQIQKNIYKSKNAIQFMMESLETLNDELKKYSSKLHYFYGKNNDILEEIIKKVHIEAIVSNMDYTPYARKRDLQILKICKKHHIPFHSIEDYLLSSIGDFIKDDGEPYQVFTPFKNNVIENDNIIPKPKKLHKHIDKCVSLSSLKSINPYDNDIIKTIMKNKNIMNRMIGGRKNGMSKLSSINKFSKYNTERNNVSIETTSLSAYIKFGCISIREVYWKIKDKLGKNNELLTQLVWREFYYYIGYYFSHVLNGEIFNSKFNYLDNRWNTNTNHLNKWKQGKTGYPIVDAGMRELNTTGYMHNRARLITSNFLNRILGQDWRLGEKYFANTLIDYDPLVNNGNWQWIASVGVDTKPYQQRIFNPWLQSEKYDPDAKYIYKWIPELIDVSPKHIHKWEEYCNREEYKHISYPKPIVDYKKARDESLKMYKK